MKTRSEKAWMLGWWLAFRVVAIAGAIGLVKLVALAFMRVA